MDDFVNVTLLRTEKSPVIDVGAISRFVAKLERRGKLPDADRAAILALPSVSRSYQANETILDQDVTASHCAVIGAGLVSRVKRLGSGSRQIVALHVPGDAVDLQSVLFTKTDHMIFAHS